MKRHLLPSRLRAGGCGVVLRQLPSRLREGLGVGAAWGVVDASAHPAATMGCRAALASLPSRGREGFVAP